MSVLKVNLNGPIEIGKYKIHQRDEVFVLSHDSTEFGSLKSLAEAISIVTKFSKNEVEIEEKIGEKEKLATIQELLDEDYEDYDDEDEDSEIEDDDEDYDWDDEDDDEESAIPDDQDDSDIREMLEK
jgi:hypothetical protein